ncbi:MAG: class IV adenylate cyclase [Ignavibacteria bacterium]|nr:class IV adenylate cyclase [Ignavibacteria bacterium]
MKNFELKVRCRDHRSALAVLKNLDAEYSGLLKQRDVYFNLSPGRLKLRTINNNEHQLIYYRRPDRDSAKFSNYYIVKVSHPVQLEKSLKEILGVKVIVVKLRKLFLWQNVRIHLDTVKSLGKFIEFEIVCRTSKQEFQSSEKMKYIKKIFNINKNFILNSSYSDMMIKNI